MPQNNRVQQLVPLTTRVPLRPGETYFVRVSQVLHFRTRFTAGGNEIIELPPECTGLRLSFLHRAGCHYLRKRDGDSNDGFILTIHVSPLAEALPHCRKCFPQKPAISAEYNGREVSAGAARKAIAR